MKYIFLVVLFVPSLALAQIDTSMYNTGGNFRPMQPMYVAPLPPVPQPVYNPQPMNPNDVRRVYMGNPQPTQRLCHYNGSAMMCN